MRFPINFQDVDKSLEFYSEVIELEKNAEVYLRSFNWCTAVQNCWLYYNLGEKLCVFLYEIVNASSKEDNFLWIVVGDLPPMYLDVHNTKSVKDVLLDYAYLAKDWVSHVRAGESTNDCYPFNADETAEMADMLYSRADFIENYCARDRRCNNRTINI